MKKMIICQKCNLCNNQLPLLDNNSKADIMWVGLSAKKVDNVNKAIPLSNDTNSGMIIEMIEKKLNNYCFYKTNLVKCLPLDEKGKLRYPNASEMESCVDNLIYEIDKINPKIIFVLGRKTYNFIIKYFKKNNIFIDNIIYIEHPSYIYVYRRKFIDDYLSKVVNIVRNIMG